MINCIGIGAPSSSAYLARARQAFDSLTRSASIALSSLSYNAAFSALDRRISLFLSLPLETLDAFALQKAVQNIGNQ